MSTNKKSVLGIDGRSLAFAGFCASSASNMCMLGYSLEICFMFWHLFICSSMLPASMQKDFASSFQGTEQMLLSSSPQFVSCQLFFQISMYRLEKMYSLFCTMQSEVQRLVRVEGDEETPSKILCAMEDGSLAVISPVTGVVLSIVYPLNTFQVISTLVMNMQHCN